MTLSKCEGRCMKELNGPIIAPKSGKARQLVIFLHGYGSNGSDLISIGEEWAPGLPDTAFVSPNAPDPCDEWPIGYQWFSIRAIDRDAIERGRQIENVAPVLNGFIDQQLEKWNVTEDRLAVVGFSQGAMMAMYTMPRRRNPCAAVIGYSGMLINAEGLREKGIVKPRILAIHGDADDVVPPSCLYGVNEGFEAAGFNVETIMRPGLEHGIDQFGLRYGMEFLQKAFDT